MLVAIRSCAKGLVPVPLLDSPDSRLLSFGDAYLRSSFRWLERFRVLFPCVLGDRRLLDLGSACIWTFYARYRFPCLETGVALNKHFNRTSSCESGEAFWIGHRLLPEKRIKVDVFVRNFVDAQ